MVPMTLITVMCLQKGKSIGRLLIMRGGGKKYKKRGIKYVVDLKVTETYRPTPPPPPSVANRSTLEGEGIGEIRGTRGGEKAVEPTYTKAIQGTMSNRKVGINTPGKSTSVRRDGWGDKTDRETRRIGKRVNIREARPVGIPKQEVDIRKGAVGGMIGGNISRGREVQ